MTPEKCETFLKKVIFLRMNQTKQIDIGLYTEEQVKLERRSIV